MPIWGCFSVYVWNDYFLLQNSLYKNFLYHFLSWKRLQSMCKGVSKCMFTIFSFWAVYNLNSFLVNKKYFFFKFKNDWRNFFTFLNLNVNTVSNTYDENFLQYRSYFYKKNEYLHNMKIDFDEDVWIMKWYPSRMFIYNNTFNKYLVKILLKNE